MISAWSCATRFTVYAHLRAALTAVSTASAAIHRQRRVLPGQLTSALQKWPQAVGVERAGARGQRTGLAGECRHQPGVRVAETYRRIRAHHVQVAAPVLVPPIDPLAAHQDHGQRCIVVLRPPVSVWMAWPYGSRLRPAARLHTRERGRRLQPTAAQLRRWAGSPVDLPPLYTAQRSKFNELVIINNTLRVVTN